MLNTLSQNLGISSGEVERLLSLSITELQADAPYQKLLAQVDAKTLNNTLKEARVVLGEGIPPIVETMKARYSLTEFPLTAFMLSNWIIGYLGFPEELWNLPVTHNRVPVTIIREVIPPVDAVFAQMGQGADAWRKAFATLVIPLASSAR